MFLYHPWLDLLLFSRTMGSWLLTVVYFCFVIKGSSDLHILLHHDPSIFFFFKICSYIKHTPQFVHCIFNIVVMFSFKSTTFGFCLKHSFLFTIHHDFCYEGEKENTNNNNNNIAYQITTYI